jgi:DNA-binding transcriptional regulator YdaS (Cro superfamily)
MEALRDYLKTLSPDEQEAFAKRCGTSLNYLRKALSTKQQFGESLVIDMERESGQAVRCEQIRPDVDWAYLRGTSKSKPQKTAA